MAINKFYPTSPDLNITTDSDMTVAKFGHLNRLVEDINAGCGGGGGGTAGLIIEGEGANSSIRCGVNNQAFGCYGSAIGGEYNTTCDDYTSSLFGRSNCAVGCLSVVNGISNIVKARQSSILSGSNNTIACDATQYWGPQITQSTYAGNYYYAPFTEAPYPDPQILGIRVSGSDVTAAWNVGDTMSGTYGYPYGPTGIGPGFCGTMIQFTNAEVICVAYENRTCGGCGTWLYTCFDLNTPAWCGTIASFTSSPTNSESNGYIQKTGSYSSYSTYGSAYHPNIIAGGAFNTITGYPSASTISGGYQNTISNGYSAIAGGMYNYVGSGNSFVGAGRGTTMQNGTTNFVGVGRAYLNNSSGIAIVDAFGQWCVNDSRSVFGGTGFSNNTRSSYFGTIINGQSNYICGTNFCACFDTIVAGCYNCICDASYNTILNGKNSRIIGSASIGGDLFHNNTISGYNNTISCSQFSGIFGCNSTICGASFSWAIGANNCIPISDVNTIVLGIGITSNRICTTHVNNLSIRNIPTSSAGLPSGSVWSDSGTLKIVP